MKLKIIFTRLKLIWSLLLRLKALVVIFVCISLIVFAVVFLLLFNQEQRRVKRNSFRGELSYISCLAKSGDLTDADLKLIGYERLGDCYLKTYGRPFVIKIKDSGVELSLYIDRALSKIDDSIVPEFISLSPEQIAHIRSTALSTDPHGSSNRSSDCKTDTQ